MSLYKQNLIKKEIKSGNGLSTLTVRDIVSLIVSNGVTIDEVKHWYPTELREQASTAIAEAQQRAKDARAVVAQTKQSQSIDFDSVYLALRAHCSEYVRFVDTEQDHLYRITDHAAKLLQGCKHRMFLEEVKPIASNIFHVVNGKYPSAATAADIAQDALNHTQRLASLPLHYAGIDEVNEWATARASAVVDSSQPFPTWQDVLSRLSDGPAFAAWIWGVYSRRYRGRQSLWMHSEGEVGKSTIIDTIASLFGSSYTSISNSTFTQNSRFAMSALYGKHFIVYPDANDPKLFYREQFKLLASGGIDSLQVEFKRKDPFTAKFDGHVIIGSNLAPSALEAAQKSRVIYQYLDRPQTLIADAGEKLKYELSGFLGYAQQCYAERCVDNYKIHLTNAAQQFADEATAADATEQFELLNSLFVLTGKENDIVDCATLTKILTLHHLSKHDREDFRRFVKSQKGVTMKRRPYPLQTYYLTGVRLRMTNESTTKLELVTTTHAAKENDLFDNMEGE